MPSIFISYRRKESSGYSRLIYERLLATLPNNDVFMDVEGIHAGENWREELTTHLQQAEVVLVVIGHEWLTITDEHGKRRLDNPEDVTRWEIESAFDQGKRIVPVLVEDIAPPDAAALPEKLKPLAGMQAVRVRHETFDADIENLIARITGTNLRQALWQEHGLRLIERARRIVIPALALLAFSLAWIGLLDLLTLDTRLTTWSIAVADTLSPPDLSADLTLVAIPPPPQFDPTAPDARLTYAAIAKTLADAGAKRVLFDMYLDQTRASDDRVAEALSNVTQGDTEVYVGFNELQDGRPQTVNQIADAADGLGLICVGERLGYTLVMPIAMNFEETDQGPARGQIAPQTSLALLGAFGRSTATSVDTRTRELELQPADGKSLRTRYSRLDAIHSNQQGCPALQPGTKAPVLFLRLTPIETMRSGERRVTMEDVLRGAVDSRLIAGRTIVVGFETDAEKFKVAHGFKREMRYGYELHAQAINALASGMVIRPVGPTLQVVILLALATAGGWLGLKMRSRAALTRRTLLATSILGYFLVAVALIASQDVLLNLSYDLFAFVVSYLVFRRLSHKWLGADSPGGAVSRRRGR